MKGINWGTLQTFGHNERVEEYQQSSLMTRCWSHSKIKRTWRSSLVEVRLRIGKQVRVRQLVIQHQLKGTVTGSDPILCCFPCTEDRTLVGIPRECIRNRNMTQKQQFRQHRHFCSKLFYPMFWVYFIEAKYHIYDLSEQAFAGRPRKK